jgi:excisionase family DNA binding protein
MSEISPNGTREQVPGTGVELVAQVAELVRERDELRLRIELLTAAQDSAQAGSSASPMLTVAEAAVLARRHPQTIRRAFEAGKLAAYRPGGGRGRVLLREDDVRAWLESQPAAQPERPSPSRSRSSATDSVAALREMEREAARRV